MKREDLINTIVYVDGRSAEIQEKLFRLGFSWFENKKKVKHTEAPFLFMRKHNAGNMIITYLTSMEDFKKSTHREITVEDILILPLNRNLNHIRKFLVVIKILKYGSVIYLDVMIVADLFILIHV